MDQLDDLPPAASKSIIVFMSFHAFYAFHVNVVPVFDSFHVLFLFRLEMSPVEFRPSRTSVGPGAAARMVWGPSGHTEDWVPREVALSQPDGWRSCLLDARYPLGFKKKPGKPSFRGSLILTDSHLARVS